MMTDYKQTIAKMLKQWSTDALRLIEIPPDDMGDYAFPCFTLGNPVEIAKEIAERLESEEFEKIEAKGPYVNFFIRKELFAKEVVSDAMGDYGKGSHDEKIMVEYSNPNPFKAFHVGHLRNTVLGIALVNTLRFSGYKVIPVNYYNDTGSHVAKCLWAFEKFYNNKTPDNVDKGEWLGELYTEANQKIKESEDFEKEYKEFQKRIDSGELNKLKDEGIKWSEKHFNKIYGELGASFERYYYDSEFITEGKRIVDQLVKKGVAEKSDDAIIVNLEKYKLNVVVVLRSDGTALYITKDFAMAEKKFEEYDPDRSVYVVGSEQINHFKQLFKILELYGFRQADKCFHLAYELVMLADGKKMSSREGGIILYSEIQRPMKEQIMKGVETRHPEWSEKRKKNSADAIFSASIRFDMLKHDPNKTINFDIKSALDFEGETGPYVQYAHARICSILSKAKKGVPDYGKMGDIERRLVKKLSRFPDVIEQTSINYRPSLLARYLIELSQLFSEFYHSCQILKSEDGLRDARLELIGAIKAVLARGLGLLGISAPEEM